MKGTKVKIVEDDGTLVPSIFVYDEDRGFKLFIDSKGTLRTNVKKYIIVSETPIIEI